MKKHQVTNITVSAVSNDRPVAGYVTFSDNKTFYWATKFGWDGNDFSYGENANIFVHRKPKYGKSPDPVKLPRGERHQSLEEYLKGDNLLKPSTGAMVFD